MAVLITSYTLQVCNEKVSKFNQQIHIEIKNKFKFSQKKFSFDKESFYILIEIKFLTSEFFLSI